MIRAYTLKLEDFTDDEKVKFVHITHVSDLNFMYEGSLTTDVIIPVSKLEDSYIEVENDNAHSCSLQFKLSYDGEFFSEEGTIEFRFKEYIEGFDCVHDFNIISTYLFPNVDMDYKYVLSSLYKSRHISVDSPVVIVPILSVNDIPDKAKAQLSIIRIEDIPYTAELFVEDDEFNILKYNELGFIDTSITSNVYLVFQNASSYSDDIVLTATDSLQVKEQLRIGDITYRGKSFLEKSLEEYNKLLENE